jgi:hypothetical protein
MSETFWVTLLGGFIAGLVGLGLFLIQRCVDSKDKEQSLLFRLYQLIDREIDIRQPEGRMNLDIKWTEVKGLSLLLKDTELGRDVYRLGEEEDQKSKQVKKVLGKIKFKLNKELVEKIKASTKG